MDADFQEKLKNVLSDPEALAKISAIASSLGASPSVTASAETAAESDFQQDIRSETNPLSSFNAGLLPQQSDPRVALLSSLKPLLREDKRGKVDKLVSALAVASMMKNFRK